MKITPIAGPSTGSVTPSVGASADVREAAKQAYLGQTPTRITQSETHVDPQVERLNNKKSIKMRTNFSTNREEEPIAEVVPVVAPNVIPDTTVANVEPEVTAPISPQLAAIARQKRALQVKESEIAAREKALADQATGGLDLAKLKANPLSILQEAGVTYEQLTEAILADQQGINPELQALKAKIDALEKGVESKLTERDAQAEQQVLAELRREAQRIVSDGDTFEMIKANRAEAKIVDLIHRTWKQTGEVMEVEDAANLLETEYLNDAMKIANLKKVQSKLTPVQAVPQQPQGQTKQMRTLTNRDVASAPTSKRARAIAAMRGQIK